MRSALEIENKQLVKVTEDLKNLILKLEGRVAVLEGGKGAAPVAAKKVTTSWGQLLQDDSWTLVKVTTAAAVRQLRKGVAA